MNENQRHQEELEALRAKLVQARRDLEEVAAGLREGDDRDEILEDVEALLEDLA